jgi:hypothetical protein
MAKTIANATIWLDKLAIASQVNQCSIDASAAEQDITTFANAGKARLMGLNDGVISVAGFWEANPDPDATFFVDTSTNAVYPVTVAIGRNAAAGAVAYLMGAQVVKYGGIGAKIGNPLAFSLKAAQSDRDYTQNQFSGVKLAQGVLAENRTAVTATGSGNIYGPLPAPSLQGSGIACAIHVTAASGGTPSITFVLKSANNVGMAGATTRATFNAITAPGSALVQLDAPITDTYWQLSWTVSGSTPSFNFAASLGNQY